MALNFIKNFIPEVNEAETDESGFGEKLTGSARLIRPDGTFNIYRRGKRLDNLYEYLIKMSWFGFYIRLTTLYFLANGFFASIITLYGVEHIKGIEKGGGFLHEFAQSLFFSIQTFTTVGYGHLTPTDTFTNLLSAFIAFAGLLMFALATGIFFARFSRPVSHIRFSKNMIIRPNKEGEKSLQFRIANASNGQLIDAETRTTLTWIENIDGVPRRKFQRLDLEVEKIFMFPLNFTLVHPIDENSPLYKAKVEDLKDMHVEVLVLIRAYDETYDHLIHSKHSYVIDDLLENKKFVTMYETKGNKTVLNLDQINDTVDA